MAIAWGRSLRQAISIGVGLCAAYGTWDYTREADIFGPFQGNRVILPGASAIVALFVAYYVAMMLLKSKAAR